MLPVHCYCCLLWLKPRLRLRLWLKLPVLRSREREVRGLHAAIATLYSLHSRWMPLKGHVRGGGLFLEPRGRPTGLFPASPLAFASSSRSSLSYLSLCSFSQSLC